MADEENETVLDTVKAAVNEQRENVPVEKGPEIGRTATEAAPEHPAEKPVAAEDAEEGIKDDGRERDASGRFKAKQAQAEADRSVEDKPEESEEAVPPTADETKPDITRPPRRLPLRTKQKWLSLPDWAREDWIAREEDADQKFKRYDGLSQYALKAEQIGTTLQQAMASYHQMETAMRQDPIRGAVQVWQRLGYNPDQVIGEILRLAGGVQSSEGQQSSPPPMQGPQGLSRDDVQMMLEEDRVTAKVRAFEDDPRHHWLEPLIPGEPPGKVRSMLVRLISPDQFGNPPLENDPEEAYNKACRFYDLDPGPMPNGSAAPNGQDKKAAAVTRSRQAAKATIGAPSQAQAAASGKHADDGNQSILDTVRAAYKQHRGE